MHWGIDSSNLIRMLLLAAVLIVVGRRWRIPYLQGSGRIVFGSALLGFARGTSSWPFYVFIAFGLLWVGMGLTDFWRQWTTYRLEGR